MWLPASTLPCCKRPGPLSMPPPGSTGPTTSKPCRPAGPARARGGWRAGGLGLALWLEADRMATLLEALTQENLDNQREVVKEEKRQRYDNVPYGDVMELLNSLTFPPDHPYGHTTIGSMEDLDAATLDDVHSFFRRHYLPNNAVLSIVGEVEPDDAFERADMYFGHLAAGAQPTKPEP